jgi:coproporphyrinogen III oxidase-like Fe-S oxidoreductase
MMGLRLAEGINLDDIAARTGTDAATIIDRKAAGRLEAQGLVTTPDNRLTVTPQGMLLLDAILAELL